jgi:hypothetical protein
MDMPRWALLAVLLFSLSTFAARADSWLPAMPRTYASADGTWRLLVTPRAIASPLAYFRDKVDKQANAGGVDGDAQRSAIGRMERLEGSRWQVVWEQPLVNEVAPVDAVVSNAGQAVTFDNWHSMGYGDDAMAFYDGSGRLIRKIALDGFLPMQHVHALPRTVSSIHWRGAPRLSDDGLELVVPVVVPESNGGEFPEDEEVSYVHAHFSLFTGEMLNGQDPSWGQVLAKAQVAYASIKEEAAAARQRFIAPLKAPATADVTDWHGYLIEAFFRLDPDWEEGYPAAKVLPARGSADFRQMSRYMGAALTDELNVDGAIMIAAVSQEDLADEMVVHGSRVGARALSRARVYVAAERAHFERISKALAHTGAKLVHLDVDLVIPQRRERLDALEGVSEEARE